MSAGKGQCRLGNDQARALTGWGRTAPTVASTAVPRTASSVADLVTSAPPGRGLIARGLGRSYGDAAQNAGGLVLGMTGLDRVRSVDATARTVDVDAGVSLETLISVLLPFGLWVPVLPGTRFVTVGGAIAADVHGKNHHQDGSFGTHVVSLDLITADGQTRTLTPSGPDPELFWATVGGMGLTGVIVRAVIACKSVSSSYLVVDTERASNLDDLLGRLSTGDSDYTYSVAWFDSTATGANLGRAVLTRGRNAALADLSPGQARRPYRYRPPVRGTVPPHVPPHVLNRATARLFNELWFRKAPRMRRGEVQDISTFFHPLDAVGDWNRLYGPRGFLQYQLIVPLGAGAELRDVVETIARSGHVSCLNVLKRFGPGSGGLLSFPAPGWTLTVDLPVASGLGGLLSALDRIVLGAGGRLYLAKDSRMTPSTLRLMYPQLERFGSVRDRVDPHRRFVSDLSRRLDI